MLNLTHREKLLLNKAHIILFLYGYNPETEKTCSAYVSVIGSKLDKLMTAVQSVEPFNLYDYCQVLLVGDCEPDIFREFIVERYGFGEKHTTVGFYPKLPT